MRFCPHCGAPLIVGAKFCVECGRQLGDQNQGRAPGAASSPFQLTTAFIAVFVGITIVGLAATAYILTRPAPIAQMAAPGAPPAAPNGSGGTSTDTTGSSGQLPVGHPKIELPTEARTFIDKIQQDAISSPNDAGAWVKLGAVSMRAALFDSSYYPKAAEAYGHVLKLQPDNPDALRGIGDIDYDQGRYDQAVAAYEHYLNERPNDPEVRTDLGTMYLFSGNADQAVVQYKKAIAIKPDLFQAYYNLGVAYGEEGDKGDAGVALTKAIALAPDEDRRSQSRAMFTKYTGMPADQATKIASTLGGDGAASATGLAPVKPGDFHAGFEQMVRNIPIAGRKVSAVQWPSQYKAEVLMDNFPMDAMPPFAKDKFMTDLKAGIASTKLADKVNGPIQVDFVDAASGRLMQSVNE